MINKQKNKTISRWGNAESTDKNRTLKNPIKVCNLGINGTMKPCCNRDKSGDQCHIKPALLGHTKRLTRSDSLKMMKEHDAYKDSETELFGSSGLVPSKYDISNRFKSRGLDVIKNERDKLKNIIQMRTNWLNKWYVPPSSLSDCYTCDANARNHNVRIEILKQSLIDYDKIIQAKTIQAKTIQANDVPSRARPKLNLTRKKDNIDIIDPVTRRQILAAMLAKRQTMRRTSSKNRRTSSKNRRTSSKNRRTSSKNRRTSSKNRRTSSKNRRTVRNGILKQ